MMTRDEIKQRIERARAKGLSDEQIASEILADPATRNAALLCFIEGIVTGTFDPTPNERVVAKDEGVIDWLKKKKP
jgi:hypothetical protein